MYMLNHFYNITAYQYRYGNTRCYRLHCLNTHNRCNLKQAPHNQMYQHTSLTSTTTLPLVTSSLIASGAVLISTLHSFISASSLITLTISIYPATLLLITPSSSSSSSTATLPTRSSLLLPPTVVRGISRLKRSKHTCVH